MSDTLETPPAQANQRERESLGKRILSRLWFLRNRSSAPRTTSEIRSSNPTDLRELQQRLVTEAHTALEEPTFGQRNDRMAAVVTTIATPLAARSIGRSEVGTSLEPVFLKAATEAGEAFRPAFAEDGSRIDSAEAQYKAAVSAAGGVALTHLPEALSAAGVDAGDVDRLLHGVTFDQVLQFTAAQLQLPKASITPDVIKLYLRETAQGDEPEERIDIDTLPISEESRELSQPQRQALDIAVRLANATWLVGQVHRAAWERNNERINPNVREAFNPYDLFKINLYRRLIAEGGSPEKALVRVAFEVWKDVIKIRPRQE